MFVFALLPIHFAAAQVTIVNNLADSALGAYDLAVSGDGDAQSFTTGSTNYLLTSVQVYLQNNIGSSSTGSVRLYSGAGSTPSALVATLGNVTVNTGPSQPYTVNVAGTNILQANTRYWIGIIHVSGNFGWVITDQNGSVGPGTIPDDDAYTENGGSSWFTGSASERFKMSVAGLDIDYGDAPSAAQSGFAGTYPVTLAANGARHGIAGPRLGALVDGETNGVNSAGATNDDATGSDDEDGVSFGFFTQGRTSVVVATVGNANGKIDAWIDWNRDGDWNDAGEKIVTNRTANIGTTNIAAVVPGAASVGTTYLRMRISTAGNLAVTNLALDGEVEDHAIQVVAPAPVHFVNLNNPTPAFPYGSWATAATNIQDAVDAAIDGETVLVTNGVYQTGGRNGVGIITFETNRVVIDKALTVQSVNGPGVTSIKGNKAADPAAVRCVWIANGATLIGFTLTNGASSSGGVGGGVYAQSTSAVLNNCTLSGNEGGTVGGGAYQGTLINCTLTGNSAGGVGGGAGSSTLSNCVVTGNTSSDAGGGAHYCQIANSLFSGNHSAYGGAANECSLKNSTLASNTASVSGGGAYTSTFKNCIVYFNTAATSNNYYQCIFSNSCSTPLPAGAGNFTDDPQFVSLATTNLRLAAGSPCRNTGNNADASGTTDLDGNPRILYGTVDMGAYESLLSPSGTIHYVALSNPTPQAPYTNWPTAATNIQDAVDYAGPGASVLVSNGVYQTGGRVVWTNLLTNRVVIERPLVVRSVNGPAVTSIKGAKDPATTSNGDAAVRCVWMTNGATLAGFTLTNGATRVTGLADRDGGGVWAQSILVVVSNCVMAGNTASVDGGGAYRGTFYDCLFAGNVSGWAGGVNLGILHRCTLIGNTVANFGGGVQNSTANNSLFIGNSAGNSGGGARLSTLYNCTVVSNSAAVAGGGAFDGTLNNCIVYFNGAPSSNNYGGAVAFSNSCSTPLPTGPGNFTNDPLFVSLATTNLRLSAGSPCRDTGKNAYATNGVTDLDGNPRIVNGVVDMGAYENQSSPSPDYDGDGVPNADETIAGSSVVNSNDVWEIVSVIATGSPSITFETISGQFYAVDYCDNLAASPQVWTRLANNIFFDLPNGLYTVMDTTGGAAHRNYRVRVKLSPFPGFGVCGNGILEYGELCDDGNTINGDGCPSDCFSPP